MTSTTLERIGCSWWPPTGSPPTTSSTPRRSRARARSSPGLRRSGSSGPRTSAPTTSSPSRTCRMSSVGARCWSSASTWPRSSAWCADTSPARAGRTTRRPARSAESSCPTAWSSHSSCPSRSSPPRPRPRWATTTRTWTSNAPSRSSATARCSRSCGGCRWRSTSTARPTLGSNGIILADTKFEFGRRADGTLVLGDEVLTPGLFALLARRHLRARPLAAQLRQAVRPRLGQRLGLGQDPAGAGASG